MAEDIPSIPEFYRDRKVLITGGTGFMGKVLIEKLLRSCPELHTVYLLMRSKNNTPPSLRVKQITDLALFDKIKEENPSVLDKLVAVSGDVKELGLGLGVEDRRMLQEEVSVIFHSAASVRFDDPITDAILINVRGTREVVNLALGMKNLKVMLHLSTTYCNFDKQEVFEHLYAAPGDWRAMIALAERNTCQHLLQCLSHKILGTLPNTYTYCKALAEHLINDHSDRLPLVIVRPSIVTSTVDEPMPGWVDNFNGPVGLYAAGGKGIMRTCYFDPQSQFDHVPVDTAIKSIITIAWHRALYSDDTSLPIYNCCSMLKPTSIKETTQFGIDICVQHPFENILWYPGAEATSNRYKYFLMVIFLHILPAILVDRILHLMGHKPMLLKIQRRIYIANMTLAIFSFKKIFFSNDRFRQINSSLKDSDLKAFGYNKITTDVVQYFKDSAHGARLYLFKEPLSSLPSALVHVNRLYWIHQITKCLFYGFIIWLFVSSSLIRNRVELVIQHWSI